MTDHKTITPCLWFRDNTEEAVNFYLSVFPNSRLVRTTYYGPNQHAPEGSVLTMEFDLNGERFMALNGQADFPFTNAISLSINCDTQEEIDSYWEKLTADGGEEVQCGWLKDKFGLSWQVAPNYIMEMLTGPDQEAAQRVMQAMMKMVKIDIPTLKKAAAEG